jgi:hypothetical protein
MAVYVLALPQMLRQKCDRFGRKHYQPVKLLCLVITELMITPSQSWCRQVLLLHLRYLLLVFFLVFDLVSKLALVLNFLFFCPHSSFTPFTTMLMVVPVVFETGLACSFELFEGAIFFAKFGRMLGNHICKVSTQLHCVRLAGFAFLLHKD